MLSRKLAHYEVLEKIGASVQDDATKKNVIMTTYIKSSFSWPPPSFNGF